MPMLLDDLRPLVGATENLEESIHRLLTNTGNAVTADHVASVSREAVRLAGMFGCDPELAETAGWLHDLSAAIPTSQYPDAARELGVEVLPEEESFPPILHQKLSAAMARELYGVRDEGVLSAVSCHTTLRAGASLLDKILFVADKLSWDSADSAPFREEMLRALDESLDAAALVYLSFMWQKRDSLKLLHPWLAAAFREMSGTKELPHHENTKRGESTKKSR